MSSVEAPAPSDEAAKYRDVAPDPTEEFAPVEHKQQKQAAELIQRNYRGYRSRRQLEGMGLDPSARWTEVCVSGLLPLIFWLIGSIAQAIKEGQLPSSAYQRTRA